MQVVAVIPARYESQRFPGKAMAMIAGKTMIARVAEQARKAARVDRVVVASDDERILRAAEAAGAEGRMTRREHRSGTERLAEVAGQVEAELYVNVQGDEPLIEPAAIDAAIEGLMSDAEARVGTLACIIRRREEIMDPNVVKVTTDFEGNALYFSRAPIPWVREQGEQVTARHLKHVGLYVFRREALADYPTLPPGDLERLEQLEQLRWLENGYRIRVVETEYDSVSVDRPEDVARIEQILKSR